jgi:molybdenum cofactor cytidylyltransferase
MSEVAKPKRRPVRIDAVVLAAGPASRMGRPKHLIPVGGIPMIVRVVEALRASRARSIAAVLRPEDELGKALLAGLDVQVVEPEDADEGRAASVRAGLGALSDEAEGLLFALADQPFLLSEDFDALIERFARRDVRIVYATYAGERGTPVLFGAAYRDELEKLRGAEGGRVVVRRHPDHGAGVPLPSARGRDIDRPEDLPE